jgi:hypothetical protein
MSALKMIADLQAAGAEILSFSSICGGLPAPEAANNPLGCVESLMSASYALPGYTPPPAPLCPPPSSAACILCFLCSYKFSWSPRGALSAASNSAQYLRNGEVVKVAGSELLNNSAPMYVAFGRCAVVLLHCCTFCAGVLTVTICCCFSWRLYTAAASILRLLWRCCRIVTRCRTWTSTTSPLCSPCSAAHCATRSMNICVMCMCVSVGAGLSMGVCMGLCMGLCMGICTCE